MEPSQRLELNKKGFCKNHFEMLYDSENVLGLALIIDTHLKSTTESLRQKFMDTLNPGRKRMSDLLKLAAYSQDEEQISRADLRQA